MTLSAPARRTLVLALSLVLVGGLAACGGGGSGGGVPFKNLRFRVEDVEPNDGAVAVELDAKVRVIFSEPIPISTSIEERVRVMTRALEERIPGTYKLIGGDEIEFTPSVQYALNTQYRIRVDGVISLTGEEMREEFVSHFRTVLNTEPPPPPPPPAPSGRIRTLPPMVVGRSSHQGTLLEDGRVLLTGGFDTSSTVTHVAETFDPLGEQFTRTPTDPAIARGFHAAVRLQDGTVLITGGVTGSGLAETDHAELFGPVFDSFSTLGSKMVHPRAFHTMTLLDDGRVLIAGGTVPTSSGVYSSRTAEIFDPATGAFAALPDMAVYRAAHTATLMPDGRVFLVGGNSTDQRAEMFDPVTDTFTTLAGTLKTPRRGHTASLLPDGTVVIVGGGQRTAELYVPDKDYFRWTPGYPLWDRKDHTASVLANGRVLLTGGSRLVGSTLFFNRTTELYDYFSGAFLGSGPNLTYATTRHRATTLLSGKVLLTGGSNLDPTQPELRAAQIYELIE